MDDLSRVDEELCGEAVPVLLVLDVVALHVVADDVEVEPEHGRNGVVAEAEGHARVVLANVLTA